MQKGLDEPNSNLIAVLFCAIIGLIIYAGLVH